MKRAVFLDRDNTIVEPHGDLGDPADVQLIRGAAHAIASLRQLGYRIIVTTNQGAVSRGVYTEEDVDRVHQRIAQLVHETAGGLVDRFYYCPFHPDGTVPEYRKDHPWRKPKPGMLLQAANDLDLNLAECWMVGDQERDIEAGSGAGCQTVLVTRNAQRTGKSQANFEVETLGEAAAIIAQNRMKFRDRSEPIVVKTMQHEAANSKKKKVESQTITVAAAVPVANAVSSSPSNKSQDANQRTNIDNSAGAVQVESGTTAPTECEAEINVKRSCDLIQPEPEQHESAASQVCNKGIENEVMAHPSNLKDSELPASIETQSIESECAIDVQDVMQEGGLAEEEDDHLNMATSQHTAESVESAATADAIVVEEDEEVQNLEDDEFEYEYVYEEELAEDDGEVVDASAATVDDTITADGHSPEGSQENPSVESNAIASPADATQTDDGIESTTTQKQPKKSKYRTEPRPTRFSMPPIPESSADTNSGSQPADRQERMLQEIQSEIRAWRISGREFTPVRLFAFVGLVLVLLASIAAAIYLDGNTAVSWVGVALVAQITIIGIVLLNPRS